MTQELILNTSYSVGNLSSYLEAIVQTPQLTKEEEFELAKRLKETGDVEAAKHLILSHLRFVVFIAKKFKNYKLPLEDLIQEGNIGLMKAVKRFDYTRGVRLASFAVHWIKAEIYDYVLSNINILKRATTKAKTKLFFNLKRYLELNRNLTPEKITHISQELNVREKDIKDMELCVRSSEISYDAPEGEFQESPAGYLKSTTPNPLEQLECKDTEKGHKESLSRSLKHLNERDQDIIRSRWLTQPQVTLRELAERWGLSIQRIHQLEGRTLKKMRRAFED